MDTNLHPFILFIDIINAFFSKGHCLFLFIAATGVAVVEENCQYLDVLTG